MTILIECCPYCIDSEGFSIPLEDDGICPICGENYDRNISEGLNRETR